jgi:hypothetical protein
MPPTPPHRVNVVLLYTETGDLSGGMAVLLRMNELERSCFVQTRPFLHLISLKSKYKHVQLI